MPAVKVEYKSEHPVGPCQGMLVKSTGSSKGALILLHAWWGLNEEIVKHAEQVCQGSGLTVLVPDLYRGKVTDDRETAGHYMSDLDWEGAVCDVRASAQFLLRSGCQRVGVSGFCMGGALSLLSAARVTEISAAAPFYGIPTAFLADLMKITIPVQGHFGSEDNVIGLSSPQDYYPLEEMLKSAGVNFELNVYKSAGHGFAHPSYPTYNKEAADSAFASMYKFMQQHLN